MALTVGAGRVERGEVVVVDGERLGPVEVMESAGSCDLGADAGSGDERVSPWLAEPAAGAQPATRIKRTAAPATERAAYERACLTKTHASERTNAERSTPT
jgi:hypothetical protein